MAWAGGNKILRVVLRATRGSDQQVNTLHYRFNDNTGGANDPQSLADTIRAATFGPHKLLYRPDWTIQPVEVTEELDPLDPTAPRSGWLSGASGAGERGADSDYLPSACVLIASLASDLIGRRFRGRMFIGGSWGESDQDTGNWTPTAVARAKALTDAIPRQPDVSPAGSTSTANWCVYSRVARGSGATVYAADVQAVTLRTPVHWLRSRAA